MVKNGDENKGNINAAGNYSDTFHSINPDIESSSSSLASSFFVFWLRATNFDFDWIATYLCPLLYFIIQRSQRKRSVNVSGWLCFGCLNPDQTMVSVHTRERVVKGDSAVQCLWVGGRVHGPVSEYKFYCPTGNSSSVHKFISRRRRGKDPAINHAMIDAQAIQARPRMMWGCQLDDNVDDDATT